MVEEYSCPYCNKKYKSSFWYKWHLSNHKSIFNRNNIIMVIAIPLILMISFYIFSPYLDFLKVKSTAPKEMEELINETELDKLNDILTPYSTIPLLVNNINESNEKTVILDSRETLSRKYVEVLPLFEDIKVDRGKARVLFNGKFVLSVLSVNLNKRLNCPEAYILFSLNNSFQKVIVGNQTFFKVDNVEYRLVIKELYEKNYLKFSIYLR